MNRVLLDAHRFDGPKGEYKGDYGTSIRELHNTQRNTRGDGHPLNKTSWWGLNVYIEEFYEQT